MRSSGTPAAFAMARERSRERRMSATMSSEASAASRLCMRMAAAPVSAATSAMAGSRWKPQTSLTIEAPAARARRATSAFQVSMEIGAEAPASARPARTGCTRAHSSSAEMTTWPGRLEFAADIDDIRPLQGHAQGRRHGRARLVMDAAVRERIGGDVDDAHDERASAEFERPGAVGQAAHGRGMAAHAGAVNDRTSTPIAEGPALGPGLPPRPHKAVTAGERSMRRIERDNAARTARVSA